MSAVQPGVRLDALNVWMVPESGFYDMKPEDLALISRSEKYESVRRTPRFVTFDRCVYGDVCRGVLC